MQPFAMTYLQFNLVFLFPSLLMLFYLTRRSLLLNYQRLFWMIGINVGPISVYVSLFSAIAVSQGVLSFSFDRVLANIGFVPLEHVLFLVCFSLGTSLWAIWIFRKSNFKIKRKAHGARTSIALFFLGLCGLGFVLTTFQTGFYLGMILIWLSPALAIQWKAGGDLFLALGKKLTISAFFPIIYATLCELVALDLKIWSISNDHILGYTFHGVPIEQIVLYGFVVLLTAQGSILCLHDDGLHYIEKKWGQIPKFTPGSF